MGINRIKQKLGVDKSKNSVNTDTFLNINLESNEKLLPLNDINHIVNVGERFDIEREENKNYRIIVTINPNISNALFNLDNPSSVNKFSWAGFNSNEFILENTTYSQAIKKYLLERDGWFGYTDPNRLTSGLCNFIDMIPNRKQFSFIPQIKIIDNNFNLVKNWDYTITYPKVSDKTHNLVNNGLLITDIVPAVVSTRGMIALGTSCLHNLTIGSTVKLTNINGNDGNYIVIRTGLDDGSLKGYFFVVDLPFSTNLINSNSRMKRIFGGVESEYYFRIFHKVKTKQSQIIEIDDSETYKVGFSENVYNDPISQIVFNEDIDVNGLVDNLGRPLTEIYLTIIKTDSSGIFGSVSSGIESPFMQKLNTSNINTYLLNIPVINKIHNGGDEPFPSHIPLETNISGINFSYYGDLVEFNKNEAMEVVLAEVAHRFNTTNRETSPTLNYVLNAGDPPTTTNTLLGPRQEGYFYKPHMLIKIREFSSYIEQGYIGVDEIPNYAINLGDNRYIWRDILPLGINESSDTSLNYPFINGSHYLHSNHTFNVRRQDPFNNWDLYWAKFPSDPIGERVTNKFNINTEDDVC